MCFVDEDQRFTFFLFSAQKYPIDISSVERDVCMTMGLYQIVGVANPSARDKVTNIPGTVTKQRNNCFLKKNANLKK